MKRSLLRFSGIVFLSGLFFACSNYERVHYDPGITFSGYIDYQIYDSIQVDDITTTCPLVITLAGSSFRLSQIRIKDLKRLGASIIQYDDHDLAVVHLPSSDKGYTFPDVSFIFKKGGEFPYRFLASANKDSKSIFCLTYIGKGTIHFPTKKDELLLKFGQPQSHERVLRE